MKYDVFISYSSADKHVADAVCSTFENSGIRCWIAPRDVFPGSDWAQSITSAIKNSKVMVLIFSHSANSSNQVTKELNLAVNNKLIVVPFKIDDSVPSGSMEYFLADMHWMDAIDGDMQEKIEKLKGVIRTLVPGSPDANYSDYVPKPGPEPSSSGANNSTSGSIIGSIYTPTPSSPVADVGFLAAYKSMWKKAFDFKGTATRQEYWKAWAVNAVLVVLITMLSLQSEYPTVLSLYCLATAITFLSLGVRRLHDSNHSGHWMWLMLSGYGAVVPTVMFFFKSVDNGNRFKTN